MRSLTENRAWIERLTLPKLDTKKRIQTQRKNEEMDCNEKKVEILYYPATKFEACKKIEQRLKIEELNYDDNVIPRKKQTTKER